jgi:hypothetical protein
MYYRRRQQILNDIEDAQSSSRLIIATVPFAIMEAGKPTMRLRRKSSLGAWRRYALYMRSS